MPPRELDRAAPFNVTAFFVAPAQNLNAEPLYLNALFEFEPSVAVFFPEGPETARRGRVAERRVQPLDDAYQAFVKDPNSATGEAIDLLLADFEEGMGKLEEAQRRPGCVFWIASQEIKHFGCQNSRSVDAKPV